MTQVKQVREEQQTMNYYAMTMTLCVYDSLWSLKIPGCLSKE